MKQQSTKSCSGKIGNDGSGRGVSDGSDGFDVCSGDNDGSGDSNGNGAVTEATTTGIATVAAATATVAKKTRIN
jgi:hypothetical protein